MKKAPLGVLLMVAGGDEEDRTPDLRIANATLSQLSYVPTRREFYLFGQKAANRKAPRQAMIWLISLPFSPPFRDKPCRSTRPSATRTSSPSTATAACA